MNLASKIKNHASVRLKNSQNGLFNAVSARYWGGRRKSITAMVRVKNEEEFLAPSIFSIAKIVDEIVIVDNASTDQTPAIIRSLEKSLRRKVRCYTYNYPVTKVGEEYHAVHLSDPTSPALLHNYYNWCLAKCAMPFVMKWDGDMIALDELGDMVEKFSHGKYLQFDFGGYNLSKDGKHILSFAAGIEPRIYPKRFTQYVYGSYGAEGWKPWVSRDNTFIEHQPLYAHMKYCKADPGSNQSPEFRKQLEADIQISGPLPEKAGRAVDSWMKLVGEGEEGIPCEHKVD